VNVAIPQRRGSEFPMNARRMDGVTIVPPAVVDERPVGYENAQRRIDERRLRNPPKHTAYSNWRSPPGYLRMSRTVALDRHRQPRFDIEC
jgi:hypothetical protein